MARPIVRSARHPPTPASSTDRGCAPRPPLAARIEGWGDGLDTRSRGRHSSVHLAPRRLTGSHPTSRAGNYLQVRGWRERAPRSCRSPPDDERSGGVRRRLATSESRGVMRQQIAEPTPLVCAECLHADRQAMAAAGVPTWAAATTRNPSSSCLPDMLGTRVRRRRGSLTRTGRRATTVSRSRGGSRRP